jgi:hypothetical protein
VYTGLDAYYTWIRYQYYKINLEFYLAYMAFKTILCKPIVLRWVQSYLSESKKLIWILEINNHQGLNKELEKDELFVNLASNEYFSIDIKAKFVILILKL